MLVPKRSAVLFLLLGIGQVAQAMELAPKAKVNRERCMRVASYLTQAGQKVDDCIFRDEKEEKKVKKYLQTIEADRNEAVSFLCNIPNMKIGEFRKSLSSLNPRVVLMGKILSESNMFVFVSYNTDIITAMYQRCLPDFFDDRAGFFNPAFNTGVQKIKRSRGLHNFTTAPKKQEDKIDKKVTKDQMIAALEDMNVVKALYVLHYVDLPPSVSSESRFNFREINDSCIKVAAHAFYTDGHESYWSFEDCEKYTDKQRFFLDSLVNSNGSGLVTDQHVEIMKFQKEGLAKKDTIKNYVLGNEKYNNALIQVELGKPTLKERIKDKLILLVPYGLTIIAPDLILSQTNGIAQGAAGILACGLGCAAFGEYLYPEIDAYNSKVSRLSPWFGTDNHSKKKRGNNFLLVNFVHVVGSIVGQKLLSWQKMPWKITGGIIYCFRALMAWSQLAAEERFSARRTNKSGLPFAMQDLMNGPKFAEINKS